ncbi:cobalt-precorrin 5A acetaldehyde-lyase [[Clostridium] aminophilum]|uniref:Cobalt-precorrin 5A acetaldehyde-lyase n=1 Tax=[Clostridium] aminophilum TaxID=1526 RepID=A0A1I0BI42_9FIRM|nr:cobalt-precorrin 5A hydrolase [[Clostridium] aminophilum]SET05901.1 cobalt-precorrin 5A acetaldehyde-lyase [[Clostridium] aminophilum]
MKAQVIYFTENGGKCADRLLRGLEGIPEKQRLMGDLSVTGSAELQVPLRKFVGDCFYRFDALIFIGAAGIAVRMTAPYIKSKATDPAVIVIDETGKYVIPILSGHLGGANAAAQEMAEILGAEAVVTTATDLHRAFAVDDFARENRLTVTDLTAAKRISTAILAGEKVGFFTECYIEGDCPEELSPDEPGRLNIVLVRKAGSLRSAQNDNMLVLIPQRAVLGIGCRRGTPKEAIASAVESVLETAGLSIDEIAEIASIDLKKDEEGLRAFAQEAKKHLRFYTADELNRAPDGFAYEHSDFVQKTTGTDNVCQRAAVLAAFDADENRGEVKLLAGKTVRDGVTVCAAGFSVKTPRF